jgi:serine/threonine-protein kinase
MIGDRLGKWMVYKELGRGGMGRVYLGQEELSGRTAALKVLAAELAQDVGFLQRFQREIESLRQLDHPNIVHFYESGYEDGLYFYAMEYVEGQSLDLLLKKERRLPWREVLDIGLHVCAALKHAHDHGIIHRDLKPANLLRTASGTVKLTDFGIAKVFAGDHLTATGGVVGTAEYLSPEQAAGKPVSKRSDLYSLGTVLYTLLTGRPPFTGDTFLELLHKHRYGQFDPPRKIQPDVPYELDEIVCQLLEKEPEKRPADGLVLGRQLEALQRKFEHKGRATSAGLEEPTMLEGRPGTMDPGRLPGPATLMSRLMREELERQKRGSALSQFLNRPIVLVPLFLLCVGLLVWTFVLRQVEPTPEPAEAANPAEAPPSEAERFYRKGERLRQEGDTKEARRLWENLVAAFAGIPSEEKWVARAKESLAEMDREQTDQQRPHPARAALKRAAALAAEGKRHEAEAVWHGLEELYRDDPSLLSEIKAARAHGKP